MKRFLSTAIFFICCAPIWGHILNVPSGSYPTIQSAIDDLRPLLTQASWDLRLVLNLSTAHLRADDPTEGLSVLELADRIEGLPGDEVASVRYNRACAHAKLGEYEEAEGNLAGAIDAGWHNMKWAREDPDFESCRDAPWFRRLLAEAERRPK